MLCTAARTRFFPVLLGVSLCLAGCMGYVQKTDYLQGHNPDSALHAAPVMLSAIKLGLPLGTDVGYESNYRFCSGPYEPVGRKTVKDALEKDSLKAGFRDALEGQGYDVIKSIDVDFDPDDELARTEYMVSAKITDIELKMCHNDPDIVMAFFSVRKGIQGELFMTVEWSVYDALKRKVVYESQSRGYTKRRVPNMEGLELMMADAFEMAAHNFGADQALFDLLFFKKEPQIIRKSPVADDLAGTQSRRLFDPDEAVSLPPQEISITPLEKNLEALRRATVMVRPGEGGHGSGVFITPQGHILTGARVVGNALRVRVETGEKHKKLFAEVLRINKARDVALLRLEEAPAGFAIKPPPVRVDIPQTSETIFVIGAPQQPRLQDTLSKGIVSAYREGFKDLDSRLRLSFIQGDVGVQDDKGGCPLFDAYGNLIGLCASSHVIGEKRDRDGLNFFIPIGEALSVLAIDYEQAP